AFMTSLLPDLAGGPQPGRKPRCAPAGPALPSCRPCRARPGAWRLATALGPAAPVPVGPGSATRPWLAHVLSPPRAASQLRGSSARSAGRTNTRAAALAWAERLARARGSVGHNKTFAAANTAAVERRSPELTPFGSTSLWLLGVGLDPCWPLWASVGQATVQLASRAAARDWPR